MALVAAAGCVVALAACTPSTPDASSTSSAPPQIMPLTGEPTSTVPDHPAVSVKIPADPKARPQAGLAAADNVWVELVEGGGVRYNAVFHSSLPEVVGPIRSIRPLDGPINGPLGGVLMASGGQQDFLTTVEGQVGQLLTEASAGGVMWREPTKRMPYNLYGSPARAAAAAENLHAPDPQWQFGRAPARGEDGEAFTLHYPGYSSGWSWTGTAWARLDAASPATDADGARIEAKTVIALAVNTHVTRYKDPAGNPVIATDLTGAGEARLARDGKVWRVQWHKDSQAAPLTLTDPSGKAVKLAQGRVWIELVPRSADWFVLSTRAKGATS